MLQKFTSDQQPPAPVQRAPRVSGRATVRAGGGGTVFMQSSVSPQTSMPLSPKSIHEFDTTVDLDELQGKPYAEYKEKKGGFQGVADESQGNNNRAVSWFERKSEVYTNRLVTANRFSLRFTDAVMEFQYQDFYAERAVKASRTIYIVNLLIAAAVLAADISTAQDAGSNADEVRIWILCAYVAGFMLPQLVALAAAHLMPDRFVDLQQPVSFTLACLASLSLITCRMKFADLDPNSGDCSSTGHMLVISLIVFLTIVITSGGILFQLQFPYLVGFCLVSFVYVVLSGELIFDTGVDLLADGFYAYVLGAVLITCVVQYRVEVFERAAYLRECKSESEKSALTKEVENLSSQLKNIDNNDPDMVGFDLESPFQRVLQVLQDLMDNPALKSQKEDIQYVVETIINNDTQPDINKQVAEGANIDDEQQAYLMQTLQQDTQAVASPRGPRTSADASTGDVVYSKIETEPHRLRSESVLRRERASKNLYSSDGMPWGPECSSVFHASVTRTVPMDNDGDHLYYRDLLRGPTGQFLDKNVGKWGLDAFELERLSGGRPLFTMAMYLFEKLHLVDQFNIEPAKLAAFLVVVEGGYNRVPYHNSTHAADVTHTLYCCLQQPFVKEHLSELDVFAAVLAAVVHDFNHPGVGNSLLVNLRHDIAVLYNSKSCLESFHVSCAFFILSQDRYDILGGLTTQQYTQLRETIVDVILATDMAQHFEVLSQFKLKMQSLQSAGGMGKSGAFVPESPGDVRLTLKVLMKVADISNPAKEYAYFERWTRLVTEEFFNQGDKEKLAGLSVAPYMDRNEPVSAKSTTSFIDFFVMPLYEAWCDYIDNRELLKVVQDNKARYTQAMGPGTPAKKGL